MEDQIKVKGQNEFDLTDRKKALEELNKLNSQDLKFLVKLSQTKGAIDGLRKHEAKLKMFL